MTQSNENAEVSEAQIASHWREEERIYPDTAFIAQANMADPSVHDRFTADKFPDYYREYADLLTWGQVLAYHPRHIEPALLEVVRGRQAQRQLQLRRPAPRGAQEQGRVHLGLGARGRGRQGRHVPGALRTRQRVRGAAQGLRRAEGGRPGDPPHADDAGASGDDARLRPTGRSALPGVRWLQRERVRRPDSRLRQQRPHHHGWLPSQRRHARPQGQGRRGRWPRQRRTARRSTRSSCGGATRASTSPRPRWSRAATSSSTSFSRTTRAAASIPCPCPPRRRSS